MEIVQYAVSSAMSLLVRRGPSFSLRIRLVVKLEEVVHFHAISVLVPLNKVKAFLELIDRDVDDAVLVVINVFYLRLNFRVIGLRSFRAVHSDVAITAPRVSRSD